ncbi:hypothetical protein [Imhoffiella purpurea]|uniref:Uncharacterized protein n=1 Tax=Imhoffiella purpurea TaxID=1249627 RepID=W9VWA3_9GAMM|nr:hypothetical protein [Imhoffiella purpurea]EXJ14730.1 hypothetical protein D779_2259 [Imhoffiella purpurea]
MHLIDAEQILIDDLKEEGELIGEKTVSGVTVYIVRHPTLGKVVLVRTQEGKGVAIELDE